MKQTVIDRENDIYQILLALRTNRRKRLELGEVFVEGVAPLKAALSKALSPKRLIYQDSQRLSDWARRILESHPEAQHIRLSPPLMRRLSEREEGSEILATFTRPHINLSDIELSELPLIIILDRPSNPGNLGSIFRSADAFGADLVITTGHSADQWDPACIRASLGAAFTLSIVHEESSTALVQWLDELRHRFQGMKAVGTDSDSEISLDSIDLSPPVVLFMGNEARGLSQRFKASTDHMVRIPMEGTVDSLNLACATSILLYEIRRHQAQRTKRL